MGEEGLRLFVVGFRCHVFVRGMRRDLVHQVRHVAAKDSKQAGRLAQRQVPGTILASGELCDLVIDGQSYVRMEEAEL